MYRETNEPYVFLAADDLAFRAGWFSAAMRVMEQVNGAVAVNDLHNMAGVHVLMARSYVETMGGTGDGIPGVVCCEEYLHAYVDDELRAVAQSRGRWGFAKDAIVEHLHVGAGKAPNDSTYELGGSTMAQGLAMLQSRSHLWS
jgi:hypothetical protein